MGPGMASAMKPWKETARHAAMRADALLEAGDMEGKAVWLRILSAVQELQQREPGERAVH